MNFVLNWLSTMGKAKMEEVISTQTNGHALPDDLAFYGDLAYEGPNGTSLEADVYRPKDRSLDPLPIAVFVHGGGFIVGSRKANRDYVEQLAERGYVVFVPEYRLLDKTDGIGAIADVCAGLAYLEAHASELGGDPSRMLTIGESAGGLLALYATALPHSTPLQEKLGIKATGPSARALALFGGMLYTAGHNLIGLVYRRDLYGARLGDEDFAELMDPEDPRVEANLPPVLQVTSGADFLKRHTLRYNEALITAGHDHRLIYYKRGDDLTHAFPSLHPELPLSREVLNELDAWFRGL